MDRAACAACGACEGVCPYGALEMSGRPHTVGELAQIACRDRMFYEASGGGVTLSGGEALAQKAVNLT